MSKIFLRSLCRAAILVAALWLFFAYAAPLLLPFLFAAAVAALSLPLRRLLARHIPVKLAAILSVTLTLAALAAICGLLAASLWRTARELMQALPETLPSAAAAVAGWETRLLRLADTLPAPFSEPFLQAIDRIFRSGASLWEQLAGSTAAFLQILPTAVSDSLLFLITFVLASYGFALHGNALIAWISFRLPPEYRAHAQQGLRALGGWLRAQGIILLLTLGLLLLGFWALRVPHSVPLAVLATMLDVVPICGIGLFFVPWIVLLLLSGQAARAAMAAVLYLISETMHLLLQPKLMGDRMQLSTLAALTAFYIGYRAGGFWGMLLLPTLASVCAAAHTAQKTA